MSVFAKSLPVLLQSLKLDYNYITLITAALFVIADAIGVFACLRRAENGTRWIAFLAPMSVYLAFTGVILCNLQKFVNVLLGIKIGIPPICGFIAAIACGMLFVGFSLLVCGSCVMRIGGRIALCLSTVALTAADAFLLFRVYVTADGHYDADMSLGSVFSGLVTLPKAIAGIHSDYPALLLFLLFILASFLTFLSNKDRYEIADGEKSVRADALARSYGVIGDDAKQRFCCRYCQTASVLKCNPDCMLCADRGIVDSNHICNEFIYDPLKKEPEQRRPKSSGIELPEDKPICTPAATDTQKSAQVAAMMDNIKKHSK